DELRKKKLLGEAKRLQLTAVENQATKATLGGAKPFVTGLTTTTRIDGKPRVQRTVAYRDVGTSVQVTPRISPENTLALALNVTESRMHTPEDSPILGKDEDGKAVHATQFILSRVEGTVTVPGGHAVAVEGVKTTSKSGREQTLVIVIA